MPEPAANPPVLTALPAAMTGRASPAKAALGDKPVFAYIASLPEPQRSIAGHVKLTFGHGTSLVPEPPVTPTGMGRASRGVEIASVDDIDEAELAAWMEQAAALPGFGR